MYRNKKSQELRIQTELSFVRKFIDVVQVIRSREFVFLPNLQNTIYGEFSKDYYI